MSNRLESVGAFPLIMDPIQAMKLGQSINNTQRQTAQTIALGQSFLGLFRGISGMFSWIGRSVRYAQEMRVLSEMNDRQLADIGLSRNEIPGLCAQGRFRD